MSQELRAIIEGPEPRNKYPAYNFHQKIKVKKMSQNTLSKRKIE